MRFSSKILSLVYHKTVWFLFTSRLRSSGIFFLARHPPLLLSGTGTGSRTLRYPGGGRYTRQYARSWLSLTILSPFLRSFAKRTYQKFYHCSDDDIKSVAKYNLNIINVVV